MSHPASEGFGHYLINEVLIEFFDDRRVAGTLGSDISPTVTGEEYAELACLSPVAERELSRRTTEALRVAGLE